MVNASLLESTFILWSADHGDGQGDHYHWRKGYPYEFSAHVPMLMRWPQSYSSVASIPRGTVITGLVSELRDIFHTAVDVGDAAGLIPAGHFKPEDGKSLLCLLKDPTGATCDYAGNPGPWRQALDMEHSTCYNESNHWNALTDGSIKYVFRAFFGDEQLFNLTADKYELEELSNDPLYVSLLHTSTSQVVACLCMWHASRGTCMCLCLLLSVTLLCFSVLPLPLFLFLFLLCCLSMYGNMAMHASRSILMCQSTPLPSNAMLLTYTSTITTS